MTLLGQTLVYKMVHRNYWLRWRPFVGKWTYSASIAFLLPQLISLISNRTGDLKLVGERIGIMSSEWLFTTFSFVSFQKYTSERFTTAPCCILYLDVRQWPTLSTRKSVWSFGERLLTSRRQSSYFSGDFSHIREVMEWSLDVSWLLPRLIVRFSVW